MAKVEFMLFSIYMSYMSSNLDDSKHTVKVTDFKIIKILSYSESDCYKLKCLHNMNIVLHRTDHTLLHHAALHSITNLSFNGVKLHSFFIIKHPDVTLW